jgi:hypothetical protein
MAGLAAVQLAIFTAESEIPTALVVTGEDAQTSALRAACHAGPTATRPHLTVFASSARTAEDDAPAVLGRLTITSVVADPGRLVLPVRRGPTLTTLAVSSGFATASLVASTAIECADAGQPISGVLVVNPDPGDPTTGRPDMSLPTDRHGRGAEGASAEFRALPTIPVR